MLQSTTKQSHTKVCNFNFNKNWINHQAHLPLIDTITLISTSLFFSIAILLPHDKEKVAFEVRDLFLIATMVTSIFNIVRTINRACHLIKPSRWYTK